MRTNVLLIMAVVIFTSSGCAVTTPIKNLTLPPVSTIEGTVTRIDEGGFVLQDNTGSILVRARLADGKKLNLVADEKIKVYGNLQGGQDRIFDGYVIKKQTGEQIIVTLPTPHVGFILQTSFQ